MNAADPIQLIQSELAKRVRKNPNYSMRAFARSVGISHTVLSLVLNGKRGLSKKAALQLADRLALDPLKRSLLLHTRKVSSIQTKTELDEQNWITMDSFSAISEWQHYAILSALELPDARFDARWISKRLNISRVLAQLSMDRLKRLGLVSQDPSGRWKQSKKSIRLENEHSSAAARKFHKDFLLKAIESLENDPFESRDVSCMTLAMDPKLLPYAQAKIRAFRRELAEELESLSAPVEVYHLSVQLFPLTRNKTQGVKP